jgi:hypothetical protein
MARLRDLLRTARELGREAGNASASWYFDRCELQREDYLRVLKGINDGDPEILDTFQSSPLSGEYSDDMTPKRLYEDLGMGDAQIELAGDEICEEYEQAFNTAYSDSVASQCTEWLRTSYTFTIELELVEQDPHAILSAMEEVAAKLNCSLQESSVSEDGEVIEA